MKTRLMIIVLALVAAAPVFAQDNLVRRWTGAIEFSAQLANGGHWGRYEIALEEHDDGNLTGRMAGTRHWDKQTTPSQLSAKLVGRYARERNEISLQIIDPEQTPGTFPTSVGRSPWGGGLSWVEPLQRHFRSLAVKEDGTVESAVEMWGELWRLQLSTPVEVVPRG